MVCLNNQIIATPQVPKCLQSGWKLTLPAVDELGFVRDSVGD